MSNEQIIQENLIATAKIMIQQAKEFERALLPKIIKIRDNWKNIPARKKSAVADEIYQFVIHSPELFDTNFFGPILINFLSDKTAGRLREAATGVVMQMGDIKNAFGRLKREPVMFSSLEMIRDFCKKWEQYRTELKALPERIERNEARIAKEEEIAEHVESFPFNVDRDKPVGAPPEGTGNILRRVVSAESAEPAVDRSPQTEKRVVEKDEKVPLAEKPRGGTDYRRMKF